MGLYDDIVALLDRHGVEYRTFEHEPVRTSEEAAQVRGTPLARGAKAILLDAGGECVLAVLSAAGKMKSSALRRHLGVKGLSFASAAQVREATGCEPGGVPPFGNLFGVRVVMDRRLLEQEWIDFNAGERTRSVEMKCADFVAIVQPELAEFASPPGPLS
jgi:Ala-tRNA(Pro) deacylase